MSVSSSFLSRAERLSQAAQPQSGSLVVIIVDDHDLFRVGLAQTLREAGIRVVGEARGGDTALRLVQQMTPDVVLMDFNMPGMSGAQVTRALLAKTPQLRVVMLTISAEEQDVMEALMAGACGYLLKDASLDEIVAGVEAAARGESMITPSVAGNLIRRLRSRGEMPYAQSIQPNQLAEVNLTEREREVLGLLVRGLDNAAIGRNLLISQNTVKNHVSAILAKLGVQNRIQAAVCAAKSGIV
jgi:DNA-binding NarL/FixJ family response regulator